MSRKLPRELDDPVDSLMLAMFDRVQGAFRATGHTPNMLTTYSLLSGLASVWAAWGGHALPFAAWYAVSLFFDCADGHYARTYGMTSPMGDLYDHAKDYTVFGLLLAVVWVHGVLPGWAWAVVALFLAGSVVHTGCQQRYHGGDPSVNSVLNVWQRVCPDPALLRYTRFTGNGVFQAVFVALVALHLASKKNVASTH